jgi:RES domain-containing protein
MMLREHARYVDLFARLKAALTTPESPFQAMTFRSTKLQYAKPSDLMSGVGSFQDGARFNGPGTFRAAYVSLDAETAFAESLAWFRHFGMRTDQAMPRIFVAIEVTVQAALDLRRDSLLSLLGVNLGDLTASWRSLQDAGDEALTQALGRAAYNFGAEALVVPSAQAAGGANCVIFPQRLRSGSATRIMNEDELTKHLR